MDPFTAATQHTDYQTAETLVVASATAVPICTEDGRGSAWPCPWRPTARSTASPTSRSTVHRGSIAQVQAALGEAAADGARSTGSERRMEEQLQYEPTRRPADEARRTSATTTSSGYEAYEQTPLVLGRRPPHLQHRRHRHHRHHHHDPGDRHPRERRLQRGHGAGQARRRCCSSIVAGIGYIDTSNWTPFMPYGWTGVFSGAAMIFFAYIGFDSVSTHAEEARNPKTRRAHRHHQLAGHLHRAVYRRGRGGDRHGPLSADPARRARSPACSRVPAGRSVPPVIITVGALTGITSVLLVMLLSQPRVLLAMARDGLLPGELLRRGPSAVPHAPQGDDPDGDVLRGGRVAVSAGGAQPHGQHRHALRLRGRLRVGVADAADQSQRRAAVPHAGGVASWPRRGS